MNNSITIFVFLIFNLSSLVKKKQPVLLKIKIISNFSSDGTLKVFGYNKVKFVEIQTLSFKKGEYTSGRRLAPVLQVITIILLINKIN
jgi:hypothetical protein